jgi:hypothetical protein
MREVVKLKAKIICILVITLLIATVFPAVNSMEVQSPNPSPRGLITIRITSKVYEVDDPYNLLDNTVKVNEGIGGHYTYDSGTPDSFPDDISLGEYRMTSSSCEIILKSGGGFFFKSNPSDVDMRIQIWDNLGTIDLYKVNSLNNLQLPNGMLVDDIDWLLRDFDQSFFSSDALPTTAPVPLTEWESNALRISGKNPSVPSQRYTIYSLVTSAKKDKAVSDYSSENSLDTPSITIPNSYPFLKPLVNVFQRFPYGFPMLRHFLGY